ncbi:MAG: hypothetical protein A3H97_08245 [Acidobacteria bacterium RIFCSPLOWO2_02_FULL_65_29]|nr:MAG: hypothetical protein A3H97_08245 [Acidobacteria bacterium RIFCSPLOWO2_02_FULL_65_29]
MKCPKCSYIGFETVDRCRNCGYEFSLAPPQLLDLPMRDDVRSEGALDDCTLLVRAAPAADGPSSAQRRDRGLDRATTSPASAGSELPFGDEPLIRKPSPPRPPLAVRRATPEVPRLRAQSRLPMLDLAQAADAESAVPFEGRTPSPWSGDSVDLEPAGLGVRALAVALDLTILLAIDTLVVYFTMKICGLTAADFAVLPKGPLLAFLVAQNCGYFIAFTAGGQTLGKMAAGIKVVPTGSDAPIDLGHSVLRTLVWVVLAVPAGLGFLTALSRDHRGLHDRCAGTRVVRLSA